MYSRQAGLRLIIRAYEISSGTSLITRPTIKHRHLFLSRPLIHLHLFRNVMNQAAVIKVSKCPVSPQSHGSSLSQSTQALLLKTNIIMLSFLQLICSAPPSSALQCLTRTFVWTHHIADVSSPRLALPPSRQKLDNLQEFRLRISAHISRVVATL